MRCAPLAVTVSRIERPSATARARSSSPAPASRPTSVLTVFGASRRSAAASVTLMPGRDAASRSNSDWADGSGWAGHADRAHPPQRADRRQHVARQLLRPHLSHVFHRANYIDSLQLRCMADIVRRYPGIPGVTTRDD